MYALTPHNYLELGKILRLAREERQVPLEVAASALFIRPHYLRALEDGVLDHLPGDAYVQGYLRRYAKFLGLPEDEVATAYLNIGALPPRRFFYIPETLRGAEIPTRLLTLGCAALAMLLAYGGQRHVTAPALTPPPQHTQMPVACTARHAPSWPPCYYRDIPLISPLMREMLHDTQP